MSKHEAVADKIIWALTVAAVLTCIAMILDRQKDKQHKLTCVKQYESMTYEVLNGDLYCKTSKGEYKPAKKERIQ